VGGEPSGAFIRRLRALTAASTLASDPGLPISRVARECGFSSSSSVAREFRRGGFGLGSKGWQLDGKIRPPASKIGQFTVREVPYTGLMTDKKKGRDVQMTVEVKTLPELHVAYIRHVGPYNKIGSAFEKLMQWAGPRGCLRFPQTKVLAVYHDNPDVTEESKLTSSACIAVPKGTPVDGPVKTMTIPGGLFAVAHAEIFADQFGEAWNKLMQWLSTSGYQSDDRICYEVYLNDHETHPEKKFIVDICEPIRPL